MDPAVGPLESGLERELRLPAEQVGDHRVVGVAAAHALRRREVVVSSDLDPGDLGDDVDELVDRHQLRRAEIEWYLVLPRAGSYLPLQRKKARLSGPFLL